MPIPFHEIIVHPLEFPCRIYPHCPGEVIYDFHWHEELELTASLDSKIEISFANKSYILNENDVALINSSEIHRGRPLPGHNHSAISINIEPSFLKDICKAPEQCFFDIKNKPEIRKELSSCMRQIYELSAAASESPYGALKMNELLYRIMYLLLTECQDINTKNSSTHSIKYKERYQKILQYMNDHYNEALSLSEVASFIHISKEHLSREFPIYVGESFREHLVHIRLRHAYPDLINTDMPLIDVAINHGFSDLRSYNRAFQKEMGIAPSLYRRKYKRQTDDCTERK
jgi:AraC-like DNA-binding protein